MKLTFLFERKVFRQMPALVVAPQQVQGGRVANFKRPQVEDALLRPKEKQWRRHHHTKRHKNN